MALSNDKIKKLVDCGYVTDVDIANQLYNTGTFKLKGNLKSPLKITGTTNITSDFTITVDDSQVPAYVNNGKFEVFLEDYPTSIVLYPSGKGYDADNSQILSIDSMCEMKNVTSLTNFLMNNKKLERFDAIMNISNKMTYMSNTFFNCLMLKSIDVSNWDTSNVTDMGSVFFRCTSLTSLDLSSWDTSKVTNMYGMFKECSSLTSLDLSGWDISKVKYMGDLFDGCTSLTSVKVSGCSDSTKTKILTALNTIGSWTLVGDKYIKN